MRKATLLSRTLIALALSMMVGCSDNASEPAPAPSPGAATGSPDAARAAGGTGSAAAGSKSIPGSTAAAATGGDTALTIGSSYSTRATDCTGRDVVIEGQASTVGLTGRCGTVTIGGRFNMVTVEAADTIKITGNSSTVIAETVGAIRLDGAVFVTVRWVKGTEGKEPTVSGNGRSCTVARISGQEYESRIRP
ncbi:MULTISPECIES: DUF3060 domain-containing protein [unclassified Streptomyces]|uniref:DUF3060 domain-containing protein n=1 Tax=unclassified Streptomyces TaxID=2593676 RepID=UPI0023662F95|nr:MULTISPECIES: DUF3060 domain-containing protein [unclassified Streptomyces]MDF3142108.1 DUF3060 domain-containing protein [Streptomyces sp. T21Q-yed]WDF43258.1 DUF3060 domain-containing protein [Streptomyces sp. T12]